MTGGAIGVFVLLRLFGAQHSSAMQGSPSPAVPAVPAVPADRLVHILLALVAIIALARAVGWVFRKVAQPPVVGEIAAGILLGPSLLGRVAPTLSGWLLPADIAPFLRNIAEIGVIIYMFLVGIELDVRRLRRRVRASVAVSHASIVAPFVLGSLLALWLYPRWGPGSVGFDVFALFIGVSMSVTAFPVLARILTDRGMQATQLGTIALTCAAVDDVTAWCLLALLVGWVHAEPGGVLVTVALTAGFVAGVLLIARPALERLQRACEQRGKLDQGTFAMICVGVLLAAVATEAIGIHALFGAFLAGVAISPDSRMATEIRGRLGDTVLVLLLPAFFAFTGMRTEIGLLDGPLEWIACASVIAVAACGKFGGAALAARVTGLSWRHSLALGALMNTRGLMELIVLNVGLDLGVISPTLFTMFVIMALVTTIATTPILGALGWSSTVRVENA